PPRPRLFPYTTLFRSGVEQGRLTGGPGYDHARDAVGEQLGDVLPELAGRDVARPRVERRRDRGKDSRERLLPISHFGSMLDKSSDRKSTRLNSSHEWI